MPFSETVLDNLVWPATKALVQSTSDSIAPNWDFASAIPANARIYVLLVDRSPGGTTTGDPTSQVYTFPVGYVQKSSQFVNMSTSNDLTVEVWEKVAVGSDAQPTITCDTITSQGWSVVAFYVPGAIADGTTIEVDPWLQGIATSRTPDVVTATAADQLGLVLCGLSNDGEVSITTANGWEQAFTDDVTTAGDASLAVFAALTTGAGDMTMPLLAGNDRWGGASIIIAPGVSATPVAAEATATWDVAQAIDSEATATWDVAATVDTEASAAWDISATVSSDAAASWALLATVPVEAAATWNVAAQVPTEAVASWTVAETIPVEATATWDVEASADAVLSEATATWTVAAALTVEATATWDVTEALPVTATATWDIYDTVPVEASAAWTVAEALPVEAAATWDVAEIVPVEAAATWNVEGPVTVEATATWDVAQVVPVEATATWDVDDLSSVDPVAASASASWDTLQLLAIEATAVWNVDPVRTGYAKLRVRRLAPDGGMRTGHVVEVNARTVDPADVGDLIVELRRPGGELVQRFQTALSPVDTTYRFDVAEANASQILDAEYPDLEIWIDGVTT